MNGEVGITDYASCLVARINGQPSLESHYDKDEGRRSLHDDPSRNKCYIHIINT